MLVYPLEDENGAGPSSRVRQTTGQPIFSEPDDPSGPCPLGRRCPLLQRAWYLVGSRWQRRTQLSGPPARRVKRQDPNDPAVAQLSSTTVFLTSISSASPSHAESPTTLSDSSTGSTATSSTSTSGASDTSTSISTSSGSSTSIEATDTSFSAPWHPSKTKSASKSQSTYVSGVMLPVTLGGDSNDEAVYSISVLFGHVPPDDSARRRLRRAEAQTQQMNLQIDLGSSDMWLASDSCTSSACKSAPALFDASGSLDTEQSATLNYQVGSVSGSVYWEQVTIQPFSIPYQAFLLANKVNNEDLSGGNFTGILGLALPANSIIMKQIPGSTSGSPDGATFLDNLFGAGASAPSQRLFSLSLERREDVRTSSSFGIGTISDTLCPSPCSPPYIPIVARPSLGVVGYLHWRIPIQGISVTTWADPQQGSGSSTKDIVLGTSQTDADSVDPLAVLDSGGVQILVGYKNLADSIYSAFNISASSDGVYRMPCTTQLAMTLTFGGQHYPIHPLDLSWPDKDDPSQSMCVGAIQYSSSVSQTADIILGSSFLKNVYSIFQYPDNDGSTTKTWQPTVGMMSLTNASRASMDFYAVRTLHQSLSSVSSSDPDPLPGGSVSPSSRPPSGEDASAGHTILSTAGIAGISVVGFFVVAAGAFCAWWFWLRRKLGASGAVPLRSKSGGDRNSDHSVSSLRSRKHIAAQRQKSMMEGYSDYEDSWASTPEGSNSIRMGYMPSLLREEEQRDSILPTDSPDLLPSDHDAKDTPTQTDGMLESPVVLRTKSRSPGRSSSNVEHAQSPSIHTRRPYQRAPSNSMSLSMSGPFPTANRTSTLRPDSSPMYDITASDFFEIQPGSPPPRGRQGHSYTYPAPRRDLTPTQQSMAPALSSTSEDPSSQPLMTDPDPLSPTGAVFRDHGLPD